MMPISTIESHDREKWHAVAAATRPEVRLFIDGDMTQPFGGLKQPGKAKGECFESLLSYTETKLAWIRHG